MSYEKVLLIGGPRDGEWVSAPKGIPFIRVVIPRESQCAVSRRMENIPENSDLAEYHRVPMHSSQGLETSVYAFQGVDPLAELIKGYRKP